MPVTIYRIETCQAMKARAGLDGSDAQIAVQRGLNIPKRP